MSRVLWTLILGLMAGCLAERSGVVEMLHADIDAVPDGDPLGDAAAPRDTEASIHDVVELDTAATSTDSVEATDTVAAEDSVEAADTVAAEDGVEVTDTAFAEDTEEVVPDIVLPVDTQPEPDTAVVDVTADTSGDDTADAGPSDAITPDDTAADTVAPSCEPGTWPSPDGTRCFPLPVCDEPVFTCSTHHASESSNPVPLGIDGPPTIVPLGYPDHGEPGAEPYDLYGYALGPEHAAGAFSNGCSFDAATPNRRVGVYALCLRHPGGWLEVGAASGRVALSLTRDPAGTEVLRCAQGQAGAHLSVDDLDMGTYYLVIETAGDVSSGELALAAAYDAARCEEEPLCIPPEKVGPSGAWLGASAFEPYTNAARPCGEPADGPEERTFIRPLVVMRTSLMTVSWPAAASPTSRVNAVIRPACATSGADVCLTPGFEPMLLSPGLYYFATTLDEPVDQPPAVTVSDAHNGVDCAHAMKVHYPVPDIATYFSSEDGYRWWSLHMLSSSEVRVALCCSPGGGELAVDPDDPGEVTVFDSCPPGEPIPSTGPPDVFWQGTFDVGTYYIRVKEQGADIRRANVWAVHP